MAVLGTKAVGDNTNIGGKKYPSLKHELDNFVIELAKNPEMGTPLHTNFAGGNVKRIRFLTIVRNDNEVVSIR